MEKTIGIIMERKIENFAQSLGKKINIKKEIFRFFIWRLE
jgi:hypothetical protein